MRKFHAFPVFVFIVSAFLSAADSIELRSEYGYFAHYCDSGEAVIDDVAIPGNVVTALRGPAVPGTGKVVEGFGLAPTRKGKDGKAPFSLGVDIECPAKSPVSVLGDGLVIHVSERDDLGIYVAVKHANGFISVYGHLGSVATTLGQRVKKGSVLGYSGLGGTGSLSAVFIALMDGKRYYNPSSILKKD